MVLFVALVGSALAEPDPWEQSLVELAPTSHLRVSTEIAANPPTSKSEARSTVGLTVAYLPNPWFAVELGAAHSPDLSRLANRGVFDSGPRSTATEVRYVPVTMVLRSQALAVFTPLQGRFSSKLGTTFGIDLGLGFGVVLTEDDLAVIDAQDDPGAQKTASQVHPTLSWMAGPRIGIAGRWSATLRIRGTHWIETIDALSLERMTRLEGVVGVARDF